MEITVKQLKKDLRGVPDDFVVEVACNYEHGNYEQITINYATKAITIEAE